MGLLVFAGEGYECPLCGHDLTVEIDKIDVGGWGDGAEGDCTCPKCGAQCNVVVEIVKQVTVTATLT